MRMCVCVCVSVRARDCASAHVTASAPTVPQRGQAGSRGDSSPGKTAESADIHAHCVHASSSEGRRAPRPFWRAHMEANVGGHRCASVSDGPPLESAYAPWLAVPSGPAGLRSLYCHTDL